MGMTKYKAVLLDFYGTLVEEDTSIINRIVTRIAANSSLGSKTEDIAKSWRFSELCINAHGECFRTQRALERASLAALLTQYQADLDVDELSDELFRYWRSPAAYPAAGSFLAALRVPTCVVSNIDDDDLDAAIRRHGWRFDHIVTSQQCRAYKPRPEPFRKAVELLGLRPSQVVHIGDSFGSDVIGARGVGIDCAWINRNRRALPEGGNPPSHIVSDVGELPGVLG
jgi:2-haloalkanoic acid dehalogenase type II